MRSKLMWPVFPGVAARCRSRRLKFPTVGRGYPTDTYESPDDDSFVGEPVMRQEQISREMAIRFGMLDPLDEQFDLEGFLDLLEKERYPEEEQRSEEASDREFGYVHEEDPAAASQKEGEDEEALPLLRGGIKRMHHEHERFEISGLSSIGSFVRREKESNHRKNPHRLRRVRIAKAAHEVLALHRRFEAEREREDLERRELAAYFGD